jgi:two-component system CheB/CheR fusion protein
MIRNLLSNALKYTARGKVLLGCRRRKDMLSIEIWDTGVGIPNEELQKIFDEYHQLDNAEHERSRGLGLGLSIVQRLADLLSHRVRVRSQLGKGSVFAIDIMLPLISVAIPVKDRQPEIDETIAEVVQRTGAVLIIEDDPEVCKLLDLLLKDQGCHTATAPDGIVALDLVAQGKIRPDLILADFNLPKGLDGVQVAEKLRAQLRCRIPVIVLTGDISTSTLRDIARHDCVQLNKPVRLNELTQAVQCLLPASRAAGHFAPVRLPTEASNNLGQIIFVIDETVTYATDSARRSTQTDASSRILRRARPSSKPIIRAAKPVW